MKGFGGVNFYLLFDLFSPLDRFEHLLFYGYTSLKDKTKYFLGSSKENLDRISYKYLQDLLILERWKRRYFK